MKVIVNVQSTISDDPPVDITWYSGDSLPQAMGAMASAAAGADADLGYTKTNSVRLEF